MILLMLKVNHIGPEVVTYVSNINQCLTLHVLLIIVCVTQCSHGSATVFCSMCVLS